MSPVEPDQLGRVQKGFGHVRPVDFKKPQHPGGVSTKPLVPLNDMGNRVRRQRIRQSGRDGDESLQIRPSWTGRDGVLKRHVVVLRFEKGRPHVAERAQGLLDLRLRAFHAVITQPGGLPPGPADDPVMCLDHGIGDRAALFRHTDGKDCVAAVVRQITQSVREVAFTLPTQAGDAMIRNAVEHIRRNVDLAKVIEPVEQPACSGRIVTDLELAQPDEPGQPILDHLGQQIVEGRAFVIAQAIRNPLLDPFLGGDERVGAEALDGGYGGKDGQGSPAFLNEAAGNVLVGNGVLGLTVEPELQVAGTAAGEGPVAVELT